MVSEGNGPGITGSEYGRTDNQRNQVVADQRDWLNRR